MRKKIIIGATTLLLAGNALGQSQVTIHKKDGSTLSFPLTAVDTLSDDDNAHRMTLSYAKQEGELAPTKVIGSSEVDLKQADKPQSYNLLQSITFSQKENTALNKEIHIDIDQPNITLVLPYLSDRSNLKMAFESTGSYLFLNGKEIESGASCDLTEQGEIKVVAFNGDIRTYHISVVSSGLPIIECKTNGTLGQDWESATLTLKDEKGKVTFNASTVKVKGRGSHFKERLKNSYNIKLDQKSSLMGMAAGKRWVLLSNAYDKSLIRSSVAFDIAAQLFNFDWTPQSQPVELILNGKHMGSYTLVEQIRISDERVKSGLILSMEDQAQPGEDAFQATHSGMTFVMRDPETGVVGTHLMRTQALIEKIETAMAEGKNDYLQQLDLASFADWYLLNELVKNEEAIFSNGYMILNEKGILQMGPIWEMSKTMGGEYGDGFKNSILGETMWFSHLLQNDSFKSLVKNRLSELAKNSDKIEKIVRDRAKRLELSAASNESVWHPLGAKSEDLEHISPLYDEEVERLVTWLQNRLDWMSNNLE